MQRDKVNNCTLKDVNSEKLFESSFMVWSILEVTNVKHSEAIFYGCIKYW